MQILVLHFIIIDYGQPILGVKILIIDESYNELICEDL